MPISKHFPIKLQLLLIRAVLLEFALHRQLTILRVELNPPSRIVVRHYFFKVPDFFYNRKIIHNKNQMIMRKKSGFTIVEQAIMLVHEFERVVRKLEQQKTPETTIERYQRITGINPCLCPVSKEARNT